MRQFFKSKNVFWDQVLQPGVLVVETGKVSDFVKEAELSGQTSVVDFGSHYVTPGLVDTHVHINEPGRTDWEGFITATQAAAAGGITTVVDMPLNCIPVTTSLTALQQKLEEVRDKLWADCGFHGGVVPGNTHEIPRMLDAGVRTFKAFMIDSGIPEFPPCGAHDLQKAMPVLHDGNAKLLVHAELDDDPPHPYVCTDKSSYQQFLQSRPKSWENRAIDLIIQLIKKNKCPSHIVHLSSADALTSIAQAKDAGLPLSAETCPHYLTLAAHEIPDGDARFKCCPPIREEDNQVRLWQGLSQGIIDFVVSDHSPCAPQLKNLVTRNLWDAWGGIASLQFGLALMWTQCQKQGFDIKNFCRLMCENPAKLVGLDHCKGRLAKGYDADFVVWDAKASITVERPMTYHRHKESAYEGRHLQGRIIATYLRGEPVFADARPSAAPKGKALL